MKEITEINEELKNKEKEKEKGIRYDPLTNDILRGLLKNSKGIETLWKKIKDNKDGKKLILYKYENDLVKLVADFTKAFQQVKENDKDNTINLGKNLASKTEYNNMVTKLLSGDTKTATEFIKKFPHWTIQVGDLFANSVHYRRIATKVSGSNMKEEDIDLTSNFDVAKKSNDKKTGKESKKGFFKSISSFFSKYIKRGGWGKASKSKVTIELAKFGKYVNEPWRRWWETVADSNTELSKEKAKEFLKSALSDLTSDSKAKLVCLFNTGTVEDNKGLGGPYVKLAVDEKSGAKVVRDSKAGAVNKMYQIFKAIDAKLGNKAEALFSGEESAANLDTNDDKIKRLIELHKIFYTDKKAIRFSEVFDKLGIKTNAKPNEEDVAAKVDELFNGSTFSNNENAKKDVKQLAEDARKFLENYYNSDKTKRLLYELKFLGSCFKINDLNKVENVDQAINVLNRMPKDNVLQSIMKLNDPLVAQKIDEELANNEKNIKSLDQALKGLDKEDLNKPEGQRKLLIALTAIKNNNLLGLGESEKFEELVSSNFVQKLYDKGYSDLGAKIIEIDGYNQQTKLVDFMATLKKLWEDNESKKIEEQNKKNEENEKKIEDLEELFKPIKGEEGNYNGGEKQLNDPKEGQKIITQIKKKVSYKGNKRTDFLKAVAKHIGIEDKDVVKKIKFPGPTKLKNELQQNQSYLLVQKIRNLIAYGIFSKNTSDKMPDDLE